MCTGGVAQTAWGVPLEKPWVKAGLGEAFQSPTQPDPARGNMRGEEEGWERLLRQDWRQHKQMGGRRRSWQGERQEGEARKIWKC